jgi:hypothetical protein
MRMIEREGSRSVGWMRSIKEAELALRFTEPSELMENTEILLRTFRS